jgi:hypothetical protein
MRRQQADEFLELLTFRKSPSSRRFLLELDERNVVNLSVTLCNAKHPAKCCETAIDCCVACVFFTTFANEATGCIGRDLRDGRTLVGDDLLAVNYLALETEELVESRQTCDVPRTVYLLLQVLVALCDVRFNQCSSQIGIASHVICKHTRSFLEPARFSDPSQQLFSFTGRKGL